MTVKSSLWLKVVSMPKGCNALQVVRKKLTDKRRSYASKKRVLLKLKDQVKDRYKLTLEDRIDHKNPIYIACVNDKVVCAVELPNDLDADRTIVEGTLSHVLSKKNGLCNNCEYENTQDCCKINFEEILKSRGKERINIEDFRKIIALA
jgi:hypothetical protein